MKKIIGSIFVSAIGIAIFFAGQNTAKYYDNSRPGFMVIGGLLQIGAFLLFLSGAKEYFLSEIIDALKPKTITDKKESPYKIFGETK